MQRLYRYRRAEVHREPTEEHCRLENGYGGSPTQMLQTTPDLAE